MKQDKILMIGGLMALTLASCSNDEIINNLPSEGARPIEYSVATSNVTRALNSYCSYAMPEQLTLWSHVAAGPETLLGKTYIDGDLLSYDGNNYSDATGTRFWPTSAEGEEVALDFIAYVDPMGTEGNGVGLTWTESAEGEASDITKTAKTYTYKGYTIEKEAANQLDFMYAVAPGAKEVDGKVTLNFRHALSQICFKAENLNQHVNIYVKSIELDDLNNTGDYEFPRVLTMNQFEDHSQDANSLDDNGTRGTWKEVDGNETYTLNFNENEEKGILTSNLMTGVHGEDGAYLNALNLLPQSKDNQNFKLNLYVENISKEFGTDEEGNWTALETGNVTSVKEVSVTLSTKIAWEQGNRYTYKFVFAKDWDAEKQLDAVSLEVTADDFVNADEYVYMPVPMRFADEAQGIEALWVAPFNLGATSNDEVGKLYYYGDTHGYYSDADGNIDFDFSVLNPDIITNLKTADELVEKGIIKSMGTEDEILFTFMGGKANTGDKIDVYQLTEAYDAAYQATGGMYRMPTKEDWEWLTNTQNVNIKQIKDNDGVILGYEFESKTTGGKFYIPLMSGQLACGFIYNGTNPSVADGEKEKLRAFPGNLTISEALKLGIKSKTKDKIEIVSLDQADCTYGYRTSTCKKADITYVDEKYLGLEINQEDKEETNSKLTTKTDCINAGIIYSGTLLNRKQEFCAFRYCYGEGKYLRVGHFIQTNTPMSVVAGMPIRPVTNKNPGGAPNGYSVFDKNGNLVKFELNK